MEHNQEIAQFVPLLKEAEKVVALTGAGISAESGIPTFRGKEGLWKTYRAEELATPEAFEQNSELVWQWYEWRRGIIASKKPNKGHQTLAKWENVFSSLSVITQNIDGLHKKSGSENILELHGNIWKVRCTQEESITENFDVPLQEIPPVCPECGALLRPHVVWFGESLNMALLQKASLLSSNCDIMFVIGTSSVVQPAASLPLETLNAGAKVVEINPDPTSLTPYTHFSFRGKAGEILPYIDRELSHALKEKKD